MTAPSEDVTREAIRRLRGNARRLDDASVALRTEGAYKLAERTDRLAKEWKDHADEMERRLHP